RDRVRAAPGLDAGGLARRARLGGRGDRPAPAAGPGPAAAPARGGGGFRPPGGRGGARAAGPPGGGAAPGGGGGGGGAGRRGAARPGRATRAPAGRRLTNLTNTARRYGAVPIVVSARADGEWVELHVADHGAGFAPEYLPRAFERFSRPAGARGGGAGLGLA